MTIAILLSTSLLLAILVFVGTILCLPLFRWNFRRLLGSSLFVKVLWWIPLYAILVTLLLLGLPFSIILVGIILVLAVSEFRKNTNQQTGKLPFIYLAFFAAASLSIIALFALFPAVVAVHIALVICFASVLSDVFAFFFGNYLPKHPLPRWINPRKSWEGVAGQIIGAFVGAFLLSLATGITAPLWLILAIGVASAIGDLFNSVAKRQLDIKDWGQTIPGHGGVLDRMSSLSTAFFVSFWLLLFVIGTSGSL